jgi:putative peptide zinc metalloprotease protein
MQADNQSIWQYISKLRPKLRGHVQLYPQVYRGERWYVLHDQSAGQFLRFNEQAYAVLGRLDGNLTLEEIYEYANETDSEHPLSQGEIISLIGQLNAAEVLTDGLPVNVQEIFGQYKAQQRKKRQRSFVNPLSIKIPLFDPDNFLTRLEPLARKLFSKPGLLLWVYVVLLAVILGLANAQELMSEVSAIELSPMQLVALWLTYPIVKAMHELGHGLAVKTWGGEVHEVGINFLVFMPVPYIDATASWSFRDKWRRMLVGAAGIFVELSLAAFALFLWLSVEPGLVKQASLNVILIATISTLLFNGNPLLRFDGYFVLEDYLEIPNLATRAKKYYYYLIQKYILKLENIHSLATAHGEKKWFLFYGFSAPVYRLFILMSITLYLADSFLAVGIALAIWAITMQLIIPLVKGVLYLTKNEAVAPQRKKGIGLITGVTVIFIAVMLIPVPSVTYTQGIVWTSGESQITAGTTGFVKEPLLASGTIVEVDEAILKLENPELIAQYKELASRLDELHAQLISHDRKERVQAAMIRDDLESVKSEFAHVSKKVKELTIYTQNSGEFVSSEPRDPVGRFVREGEVIGHIVNHENLIIKATVPQSRIGLLQTYETTAEFMLADQLGTVYESKIIRQTPKATKYIPTPALGTAGGGDLGIDPSDKSNKKLLKPVFQIDISVPKDEKINQIGGRVYVRLNHGYLPVGQQLALYFNQLFLRHFYAR